MRYRARRYLITAGFLAPIFLGVGCWPGQTPFVSESTITDLQKLKPAEVARVIRFKSGSSFELHQATVKINGEFIQGEPALSQRVVTLNAFEPGRRAELQWTLQQKVLTAEYKQSQEAFEKGATTTKPEPKYGQLVTSGSLTGIDLRETHQLYLPMSWAEGEGRARGKAAVWVSPGVYEELTRTRTSTVYWDILSELGLQLLGNEPAMKAFTALKQLADGASLRTDLDLMKAEGDFSDWKLQVNGKEVTVQVIRARSWYGEMVVLNNPDNPLILKLVLNPPLTGDLTQASPAMNLIKGLVSYEITRIDLPTLNL